MVERSHHPPQATVLIVDDLDDIRLAYRFILEAADYRVLEAASAGEALKRLGGNHIDLMLADLYMPGDLDGVGLISAVKRMPGRKPAIIAMSGAPHLAFRSSLQAARYVGADLSLVKPIDPEMLVTSIRNLIGDGGPTVANAR